MTCDNPPLALMHFHPPPLSLSLECGHGGLCWTCAKSIVEAQDHYPLACPMCRKKITSIIRIPEEAMMSDVEGQMYEAEEGIRVRIAGRN
jgi:DNA-directed RNA polymerase subunit RPC12/RpoP